ncbi:membrane dipeptidase [Desulfotomaculum arcticum]|uniref:Membrane dipeptidase n=1 Tax=Desulfotruncus arcticus DSM 17038 TaxID=1121424 RepID=A0A1I2S9P1_9FIRM|nr:dipeptidase [Desulfotruncus arcticus]SFG48399.1 membrane dipeptidase [Desulfotomaculum arcticum] [Desulfotruncus arcticus DSM 17038]
MRYSLVVDGHCDTLTALESQNRILGEYAQAGQLDLPRMRSTGINVQLFAIFINPKDREMALKKCLYYIDKFYGELNQNCEIIEHALSGEDILRITGDGKIAAVLSIEGGECVSGDLAVLRMLYRLGVRSLTLTWNARNELGDGVGEGDAGGGLSKFGRSVVREMNNLGMLIDVAHLSQNGFWHVAETSDQPFAATHANCRFICDHPRNLDDKQIKYLAKTGGLMGLTLVPEFIDDKQPGLDTFLRHVDHIASIAGTKCIGLGSDFDGMEIPAPGLEDVTCIPVIAEALLKRGYSNDDISDIMGGNWIRLLKQVIK